MCRDERRAGEPDGTDTKNTVARSKDQIRYIRYEYIPKTDTGVPRETEGKEYAV